MRVAYKSSVGDDKSRQVVKTTNAISSTNDTKALVNRPNTTKKRSKQIHQREWEVDKIARSWSKDRARNTDFARSPILPPQISPSKTFMLKATQCLQEDPFQNPREA